MKTPQRHMLKAIVLCLAASISALSAAVWTGNGDANASGNWSTPADWDTGVPVTNSDVTLGDVTGARTVTFDSSSVTIQSLTMTQTTANGSNILSIPGQTTAQTLTVNNAINLGTTATGATVGLSLTSGPGGSATPLLNAKGGLTVGTGGSLTMGLNSSSVGNYTAIAGDFTLSGGLVRLTPVTSGLAVISIGTINSSTNVTTGGTTTINSGTLRVENNASSSTLLQFSENLNWNGGAIQYYSDGATLGSQSIILRGLTNTIGADAVFQKVTNGGSTVSTVAPGLTLMINSANYPNQVGAQSLTSAVALGNIVVQDTNSYPTSTYTHTVASTAASKAIGAVTINSQAANVTFQLGSDLNSTAGTYWFIQAQSNGANNDRTYGVDLNGYTFDGATGNSNNWIPNRPNTGGKVMTWSISSTQVGGTLKAKGFDFRLAGSSTLAADQFLVGHNVILESTGGNGTANILTGATASYTINAGSTFRYSGSAVRTNAATLVSGVAIGKLEVQNGALKIAQASLTAAGGAAVSNGGTLDLNGASAGVLQLGASQNFTSNNGTLLLGLGDNTVLDQIVGSGGTFSLVDSTISLSLGTGFDYTGTYAVFSGFSSGSITNLQINGYDETNYTAVLSSNGTISFVPEPETLLLALGGFAVLLLARKRRMA